MPNYENTKIYKLWTHLNDDVYIGSTTLTLAQRLAKHKSSAKKTTKGASCSSSVLFENDCKVMIELIEEFSCENRMNACKREGELIRANSCINKNMPGLTHKESMKQYYETHREACKESMKQYYETHKEQLKETRKQYYETHKEQLKESMKEYNKKYYLKCKEEKKVKSLGSLETFDI